MGPNGDSVSSAPVCAPTPIERILRPFDEFVHRQASGGLVLLICAATALLWANSPWGNLYSEVWQTPLSIRIGSCVLEKPLLLWINDGLMAIFFFVIGLEIKREMLSSSSPGWRCACGLRVCLRTWPGGRFGAWGSSQASGFRCPSSSPTSVLAERRC